MVVMRRNARLRRGVPRFVSPAQVSDGHLPTDANDLRCRCRFNGSYWRVPSTRRRNIPWLKLSSRPTFRVSLATHVAEPDSWTFLRLEIQRKRACATTKVAQIRGRLALAVFPFQLTRWWTRQEWTTTTQSHRIEHFRLLLVYSVPRSSAAVTTAFPLDHSTVDDMEGFEGIAAPDGATLARESMSLATGERNGAVVAESTRLENIDPWLAARLCITQEAHQKPLQFFQNTTMPIDLILDHNAAGELSECCVR